MTERIPTVRQIDKARTPLRQACELALQIEALDGYAPDERTEQYRRQFITNLEWAALRLGFELRPVGPVLAIDNTREA